MPGGGDSLRATVRAGGGAGAAAAGGRRWFLAKCAGPARTASPLRMGLPNAGSCPRHQLRRRTPSRRGMWPRGLARARGGPACYVGVRKWREQRQVLRGLPHDRVPQPFAGCTVAEQEEGVTGTDFALPDGVTMCGLCRTPVYFEHHYSGRVHTEKAEAAAAGGRGRVRKRGNLSDSWLLGLCRQRCAESPAFAAMLAPMAAPASSSPPRAISRPPVPHQAPPVACLIDDNHTAAVPPPGSPPTPQSPVPRAPLEPVGQPPDAAEPGMVAGPATPLV